LDALVPGEQGAGVTIRCGRGCLGSSLVKAGDNGPVGPVWLQAGDLTAQDLDLSGLAALAVLAVRSTLRELRPLARGRAFADGRFGAWVLRVVPMVSVWCWA
jgi:hypothetical protein